MPDRSTVADAVIRCRTIGSDKERLRCFDAAAWAFDGAITAREVVVVHRAWSKEERRARFGERRRAADLPGMPGVPGVPGADGNKLNSLASQLAQAVQTGDGNWALTLAEGSHWLQTEGQRFVVAPRAGEKIVIKHAALGTYKLAAGGRPVIRVRRRA
ncbi:hypothetical protein [Sphingomonas phyllosphaerae]|uniref:hypothetical protein n=1 Tax=Sphingomonas phyllosphaerae TaxID=257003 RepID=UPI0003B74A10|nr:hypothetical protein [Sphingomonas phyllosphaerae]